MELTVTEFVTLDGVVQAPGGPGEDPSGGFAHGGWVQPHSSAELGAHIVDIFSRADAFLLGRGTYGIFSGYWPRVTSPDDPIAGPLNRLPKHVASTTLRRVEWTNSKLLEGDTVEAVRRLKASPGRELQVHGSCGLLQTLLEHDLVDVLRLHVIPVTLGSGRRLFAAGTQPRTLRLDASRITPNGVALLTYRFAGPLRVGTIGQPD
ncbi:dihydrofolate reductase [Corallococcus carmarthensis]|uniref:Dihydrofolate reductase n=2 Tax=Corallococcus carmarthensis TaxID=2316728 RepID=A0A3A8K677_9BACT|nr:dihydrofolate reductase family protein [Corallococcus carmarthensis]NOK20590.1 dihydrofolate reductase [Corallococcus carmarthensis]RKG97971.1 dihydrofolate reductase [Corallococcus carmarthensis]